MNFRNLLFCIANFAAIEFIYGQCNPAPEDMCDTDNYFCSMSVLNGFTCSTSPNVMMFSSCIGEGCGPSGPTELNGSWWKFRTNGGNVSITVSYNSCTNPHGFTPSGLQFGLIWECSCYSPLICHSACGGTSGSFTYNVNLTRCRVYSFWINGCNGDVCNYTINITGGDPPVLDPIVITQSNPNNLCATCCSEFRVDVQPAECYTEYLWTLDGVPVVDGTNPKVNICFPSSGNFTVCIEEKIESYNGAPCDVKTKCKQVNVIRSPDVRAKDFSICEYQIPYKWNCNLVTASGEYRCEYVNGCCHYDSVVYITVLSDEDQICLESQYVTGLVYLDKNKNGLYDQTETILENQIISSDPLGITSLSKKTGYSIFVHSFNLNTIKLENLQANRWNVVPSEHLISVGKQIGKQKGEYNFALQLLKERDLSVIVSAGIARAGRKNFINLVIENYAEDVDDYTVDLQLPSTWIYRTASLKPTSIIANKLEWNISTKLLAFEKKLITIEVEIPASAQVGDKFEYIANVSLNQDEDITNNKSVWKGEIVQSFDPNDKQVSADRYTYTRQNKGELIYTIRFMNTGSDTAVNVLIKDTLNRYLDPSTVRVLNSSHPVKMLLSSPDKFDFYFERIMLPDSSKNFVASQGFIQFAVKPNARFDLDAEILNRAAIYFDQNAPVATNTSVFSLFITGLEGVTSKAKFTVLPNPANHKIHIILNESLDKTYDEVKITSLDGRTFRYKSVKGEIDISALPNAFYYIELLSKGASLGRKSFVKQ
jgi:uncharacterized repeat protein (TIGR01451 family)